MHVINTNLVTILLEYVTRGHLTLATICHAFAPGDHQVYTRQADYDYNDMIGLPLGSDNADQKYP